MDTDYAVVFERGADSWGAYVPDLPGCIAVAESRAEVLSLIRQAMAFHLEGLQAGSRAQARERPADR